jgi:hypothetical protein
LNDVLSEEIKRSTRKLDKARVALKDIKQRSEDGSPACNDIRIIIYKNIAKECLKEIE